MSVRSGGSAASRDLEATLPAETGAKAARLRCHAWAVLTRVLAQEQTYLSRRGKRASQALELPQTVTYRRLEDKCASGCF